MHIMHLTYQISELSLAHCNKLRTLTLAYRWPQLPNTKPSFEHLM